MSWLLQGHVKHFIVVFVKFQVNDRPTSTDLVDFQKAEGSTKSWQPATS
jgi:hypothetical protein